MQDDFNTSSEPGATPEPTIGIPKFDMPAVHKAEVTLRDFGLTLKRRDDGTLHAKGNFDMEELGWPALPDLSMVDLEGDFRCRDNNLKSLRGLPRTITGVIDCRENPNLEVLGDAPQGVKIISDYGTFNSVDEAPAELQRTAKEHLGSVESTVLRNPVKVGSALSFRKKT